MFMTPYVSTLTCNNCQEGQEALGHYGSLTMVVSIHCTIGLCKLIFN